MSDPKLTDDDWKKIDEAALKHARARIDSLRAIVTETDPERFARLGVDQPQPADHVRWSLPTICYDFTIETESRDGARRRRTRSV